MKPQRPQLKNSSIFAINGEKNITCFTLPIYCSRSKYPANPKINLILYTSETGYCNLKISDASGTYLKQGHDLHLQNFEENIIYVFKNMDTNLEHVLGFIMISDGCLYIRCDAAFGQDYTQEHYDFFQTPGFKNLVAQPENKILDKMETLMYKRLSTLRI